ncbi:hyporthetical protein [Golovinomyces cichoracearum]|uniref:Hyporthetical protein n=1 Tax=Golovinomyces cichoracearum TaxID=62708 RepID=A0A420IA22_9PEZI|nr:hyporthetical protein [Golovinomyces cichoracearum]
MTEVHQKSQVRKSLPHAFPTQDYIQNKNPDQKAPNSEKSRTIHPTTYQFQQPLIKDEKVETEKNMGQLTEPITSFNLDDVTNVLAYQTIPPLEFLNQESEPNAAAFFSKIWDKTYSYTGEPYDIFDEKIRYFMSREKIAQNKPSQMHSIFPMILSKRAQDWFIYNVSMSDSFTTMYKKIKLHFDVEVNHHQYYTDWTSMTFGTMLCQRTRGESFSGDLQLKTNTERAFKGVPNFEMALYDPPLTFEALASKLRSSLKVATDRGQSHYFQQQQFYTDRRHTKEEQQRARELYNRTKHFGGRKSGTKQYRSFLVSFEGESDDSDSDGGHDSSTENNDDGIGSNNTSTSLFTSPWAPTSSKTRLFATEILENGAFSYQIAPHLSKFNSPLSEEEAQLFVLDRYSQSSFQGILPDTGAAKNSTGGLNQFLALQQELPSLKLDKAFRATMTMTRVIY